MSKQQDTTPPIVSGRKISKRNSSSFGNSSKSFSFGIILSLISALFSLVANVIGIYAFFGGSELPSTYQILLVLAFSLILVLIIGSRLYKYQNDRRQRIISELREVEATLFSSLEQDMSKLLGVGETNEQPTTERSH